MPTLGGAAGVRTEITWWKRGIFMGFSFSEYYMTLVVVSGLHLALWFFLCLLSMKYEQAVCVSPSWLQFLLRLSWQKLGLNYYLLKSSQTRGLWFEGTFCCISVHFFVWVCFCSPGMTLGSSMHTRRKCPFLSISFKIVG